MKQNNLYIVGGDKKNFRSKIKKNSKVIFLDKEDSDFHNQFSLTKNFLNVQDFFRKKWISLQEEVFIKIYPKIIKDKDYRYILSNLFFESSPYKTNIIYKFYKFFTIIDYIKKEKIKKIYLINLSYEEGLFFDRNISNLNSSVHKILIKKKFSTKNFFKKNFFLSLIYQMFVEIRKKKQIIKIKKTDKNKVVLSYYPANSTDRDPLDQYFLEVSKLLKKDYSSLFIYLNDISKISQAEKFINKNKDTYGFIDAYIFFKDYKSIIVDYYRINKKLKSIKLSNLFIFEEINYIDLFKNDWLISISHLLIILIIIEKKFNNFFLKNPSIKEVLYLAEFQPWELMLNKIANLHNVKTKAVTHAVIRPNLLQYHHSKMIHEFLYNPNFIGANSDLSKSVYLQNGFKTHQVLKIEAQRFNYLLNISKKNKNKKKLNKRSILITTSINHDETKELLEIFSLSNIEFDKVYIKEHPNLPVKLIIENSIKNFPSYEIVTGSISNVLEFSDIVLTANGSSVLLEAVVAKKQTISLISLSALPMPAIERSSNLYFVFNHNSLSEVLKKLISDKGDKNQVKNLENYLYLDTELKLWDNFLKI